MKIEFVVDHKVQQHDGKGPEYKKGQVYDLERSYAEKYKRLKYAVDAVEGARPGELALEPLNPKATNIDPPLGSVEIPLNWREMGWPELKSLAARLTPDAVKDKKGAVAAVEAEILRRESEPQRMIFHKVEKVPGERKFYIMHPWPKVTLAAEEYLSDACEDGVMSVDGNQVTISVANGIAVYAMGPVDQHGLRRCTLAESTFEPPPAAE